MSMIFILAGWGKLLAPATTQAMLSNHHLPMVQLGWILGVVVELGGGLAILFGLLTRREANGVQVDLVALAMANRPSVDFCRYWQRSRAA